MRTIIAKADTIVAFHIGRGGRFNNAGHVSFYGEARIGDYANDLFRPMTIDETTGEPVDDLSPDAEWRDASGNGVGLTNAMVESGIGHIDNDGPYDTTYTMKLDDVEEESNEWEAIFREPNDCRIGLDGVREFLKNKYE